MRPSAVHTKRIQRGCWVAGSVVLEERDDERDYHSRLMADSMVVALADNQVEWIAMPGQVSGQIEVGDRRSWIEGPRWTSFLWPMGTWSESK